VQRANHHCLLETVAAARELSLTSLSFLAADVTSTAFGRNLAWPDERQASVRLTPQQTETLRDQIEELIRAGDGFVSDTPRHLRRIVAHFRALLGLEEFEAPRCNAPWVSAVLEPDGALRPCFFHPVVGSLAGGGLAAALNGPSAKAFRQNLNIAADRVCRRCVCSVHYAQD
jgi:MoaA/NifB/PqqE/SkfB family radical SAM enzyme